MRPSIYLYRDYKSYLTAHIQSLPKGGRGFKSRMAELMKSDVSFVSKVLNGTAQLNLEQAESLQRVLLHEDDEALVFLVLVLLARAKTTAVQVRLEALVERLQAAQGRGRGVVVRSAP